MTDPIITDADRRAAKECLLYIRKPCVCAQCETDIADILARIYAPEREAFQEQIKNLREQYATSLGLRYYPASMNLRNDRAEKAEKTLTELEAQWQAWLHKVNLEMGLLHAALSSITQLLAIGPQPLPLNVPAILRVMAI